MSKVRQNCKFSILTHRMTDLTFTFFTRKLISDIYFEFLIHGSEYSYLYMFAIFIKVSENNKKWLNSLFNILLKSIKVLCCTCCNQFVKYQELKLHNFCFPESLALKSSPDITYKKVSEQAKFRGCISKAAGSVTKKNPSLICSRKIVVMKHSEMFLVEFVGGVSFW